MPAHTGAMSLKKTSSYYNFIILLGVKGQANSEPIKRSQYATKKKIYSHFEILQQEVKGSGKCKSPVLF